MTLIDEVQAKFLHFHFGIIPDSLEEHHGQVKVSWYFGPSDNPHTISGQDFMYIKNGLVQSLDQYSYIPKPSDAGFIYHPLRAWCH